MGWDATNAMIVDLDTRKWGNRPHWRFPSRLLGQDVHGVWLGLPVGTPYTGPRGAGQLEHGFVTLVPPKEFWIASFQASSHPETDLYVDITTHAEWLTDAHVTVVDLDLDVIRFKDGRMHLDDEDEFAEHQMVYDYPPDVIERAESTARQLMRDVAGRREPFGDASACWLDLLVDD